MPRREDENTMRLAVAIVIIGGLSGLLLLALTLLFLDGVI